MDSSVWLAHFRKQNPVLQSLLAADRVRCHPLIVIEIACGTPPSPRRRTLADLKQLRSSTVATTDEALALIEKEQLQDSGCGAVDMALLASTLLSPDTVIWTIDHNLGILTERFDVAFDAFN